jgi:hypothetical protein
MRVDRFLVASLTASAAVASAPVALAQNIGMPAGARQFIEVKANAVAAGTCCDDAVGGVGSIPDPSPDYLGDPVFPAAAFIYANGDSTANRLRNSYANYLCLDVFVHNSLVDTYTISGPPGTEGTPVNARMIVRATGTIFVGTTNSSSGGIHLGSSVANLEAGTWNTSTDPALNEQFRVVAFGSSFEKFQSIPFANYGSTTPTAQIDMTIDEVLTRTVGTPFDVAFGFNTTGNGAGNLAEVTSPADDGYVVATIDWELPAGYSITSALGWTDPTVTSYCTAGTSGSGCTALLSASGIASATQPDGFVVSCAALEGDKDGLFFFGTNGRLATPWGTSTSFLCVAPPTQRCGLLTKTGTPGGCDGTFSQDLNQFWCPTCPRPDVNPGAGAVVDLQLWYRDPLNLANSKTTSLSDALEFTLAP